MLTTLLLLCGLAFAGLDQDLQQAANGDLSEAQRREAFNSLTRSYATERPQMEAVLFDQKADARQRWVLARSLGHTGSKDAMKALLKLCEDPMPAMRAAAAGGLGDLGFKDASPTVAGLLEDDAIMVRGEAAIALGKIGDHASAPALETALRDRSNFYRDQSLWVRVHYVNALGQIGAPSSTPVLIAALEDQDRAVQDAALAALREAEGFDFAEGRTRSEHIQAWQRWYAAQDR